MFKFDAPDVPLPKDARELCLFLNYLNGLHIPFILWVDVRGSDRVIGAVQAYDTDEIVIDPWKGDDTGRSGLPLRRIKIADVAKVSLEILE